MALPVLVLALGLGGCSSDGDGATRSEPSTGASSAPSSATPSSGASQGTADWAAYYDCLGAQGLKLQDTGGGEKRVDKDANKPEAIAAAEKACAAKQPGKGQADPAKLEAARKLSACMRKEGVADYPDPDPATGEVALDGALGERMKGDPKVIAALKACGPKAAGGDGGTVVGG
ncbi:hypothetical protein [Streptomyces globisporus]|uniref:hypothetical protein n=1 Tax=Streptomyces globisporus TaxID=1908 RepID=UPI000690EDCD|nr:hypothetical protein [Streptomyces globisporus]